mmetsp:Transcript_19816/g.27878  ORF Transcript_19816/g.27878 Transcript_19816/m.27878 type:complete len:207 (+) Transcript_19816:128-748(+)
MQNFNIRYLNTHPSTIFPPWNNFKKNRKTASFYHHPNFVIASIPFWKYSQISKPEDNPTDPDPTTLQSSPTPCPIYTATYPICSNTYSPSSVPTKHTNSSSHPNKHGPSSYAPTPSEHDARTWQQHSSKGGLFLTPLPHGPKSVCSYNPPPYPSVPHPNTWRAIMPCRVPPVSVQSSPLTYSLPPNYKYWTSLPHREAKPDTLPNS